MILGKAYGEIVVRNRILKFIKGKFYAGCPNRKCKVFTEIPVDFFINPLELMQRLSTLRD